MTQFIERRKNGEIGSGVMVSQGEVTVVEESTALVTITGRGVAVCLWQKESHVAGMCHFSLPGVYDPSKATCVYGNVAVPVLLDIMKEWCEISTLEAFLFGGAAAREADMLGIENVDMARKVLAKRGVPIVSEDIGGSKGRKVLFDTGSGHAAVLKVHNVRKEDWGY